ncbi:AraC family transcriptional regulator [Caenispirillum bisanense]|uniref:AraC family transcriptional regulator n=1 Tax=Caenispirillum bisanense TaxID=414052 RepID=UPI0031DCCF34
MSLQPAAAPVEHSRFWRHPAAPGCEFFAASFTHHAFARHAHDECLVGVVESGVESFNCRGSHWLATRDHLLTTNPGDIHDGSAGAPGGYRYRVLYLDPPLLEEVLRDAAGRPGSDRTAMPFYRQPVTPDPQLAEALRRVLPAFDGDHAAPGTTLGRQTALLGVLAAVFGRHAGVVTDAPAPDAPRQVRRAMEFMAANLEADLSLEDVAAVAGLSRFQLVRAFRRATGCTPHAYLMERRLAAAKARLRAGEPPAQVAAAVGLYDQPHFTRRFKRLYGITPGAYQAGVRSGRG